MSSTLLKQWSYLFLYKFVLNAAIFCQGSSASNFLDFLGFCDVIHLTHQIPQLQAYCLIFFAFLSHL